VGRKKRESGEHLPRMGRVRQVLQKTLRIRRQTIQKASQRAIGKSDGPMVVLWSHIQGGKSPKSFVLLGGSTGLKNKGGERAEFNCGEKGTPFSWGGKRLITQETHVGVETY